jgi:hypothetical protein
LAASRLKLQSLDLAFLYLMVAASAATRLKNFESGIICMQREEKLRLSADESFAYAFRHGVFTRFYEQSLHWFSLAVKPLKPMLERVKDNEPVVYGGLPIASFEKLLEEGVLQQVDMTEYGWRWPYAAQQRLPEDAPMFDEWRTAALAEAAANAMKRKAIKSFDRDIHAEILIFNLAIHSPMQAMNAIADWQAYLRERAG